MSDAKRTPYRQQASVRERKPAARGTVVRRADEPLDEEAAREAKHIPSSTPIVRLPDDEGPDAGVFSGLVSPLPESTPGEAAAQRVLTLLALPLILTTLVMVGWFDTRRAWDETVRRGGTAPRPVGIAHPFAWVIGALPIAIGCFANQLPWIVPALLVAIPMSALFARRALRRRILENASLLAFARRNRR